MIVRLFEIKAAAVFWIDIAKLATSCSVSILSGTTLHSQHSVTSLPDQDMGIILWSKDMPQSFNFAVRHSRTRDRGELRGEC